MLLRALGRLTIEKLAKCQPPLQLHIPQLRHLLSKYVMEKQTTMNFDIEHQPARIAIRHYIHSGIQGHAKANQCQYL